MDDRAELRDKLTALKAEHRDLDTAIAALTQPVDQIRAQRLKKRKLALKDMIRRIEDMLMPDIIA